MLIETWGVGCVDCNIIPAEIELLESGTVFWFAVRQQWHGKLERKAKEAAKAKGGFGRMTVGFIQPKQG